VLPFEPSEYVGRLRRLRERIQRLVVLHPAGSLRPRLPGVLPVGPETDSYYFTARTYQSLRVAMLVRDTWMSPALPRLWGKAPTFEAPVTARSRAASGSSAP
jgi:hypothetical protein